MSPLNPLPSLFGRFTSILQGHHHLGKTIGRLRVMCAALEDGQSRFAPEIVPGALIRELRADLGEHFAAEESDAYFGTVLEEAPALASEIAGLKWDHLDLLRAADVLCGFAGDQSRWSQLPGPTRELMGHLDRHEISESALLRNLFSQTA